MSTKIYNGYRIVGIKTIKQLLDFHKKVRAALLPKVDELYIKAYWATCELIVASLVDGSKDVAGVPYASRKLSLGYNTRCVLKALGDNPSRSYSVFDPRIQIGYAWSHKGSLLVYYIAHLRDLEKLWEAIEGVESYPYWDNTDPPDDMTWRQWKARGDEWDRIFGDGIVKDAMVWQYVEPTPIWFAPEDIPSQFEEMISWNLTKIKRYLMRRNKLSR